MSEHDATTVEYQPSAEIIRRIRAKFGSIEQAAQLVATARSREAAVGGTISVLHKECSRIKTQWLVILALVIVALAYVSSGPPMRYYDRAFTQPRELALPLSAGSYVAATGNFTCVDWWSVPGVVGKNARAPSLWRRVQYELVGLEGVSFLLPLRDSRRASAVVQLPVLATSNQLGALRVVGADAANASRTIYHGTLYGHIGYPSTFGPRALDPQRVGMVLDATYSVGFRVLEATLSGAAWLAVLVATVTWLRLASKPGSWATSLRDQLPRLVGDKYASVAEVERAIDWELQHHCLLQYGEIAVTPSWLVVVQTIDVQVYRIEHLLPMVRKHHATDAKNRPTRLEYMVLLLLPTTDPTPQRQYHHHHLVKVSSFETAQELYWSLLLLVAANELCKTDSATSTSTSTTTTTTTTTTKETNASSSSSAVTPPLTLDVAALVARSELDASVDYYAELELLFGASPAELKSAHSKLPEVQDGRRLLELTKAFCTLMSLPTRRLYDIARVARVFTSSS